MHVNGRRRRVPLPRVIWSYNVFTIYNSIVYIRVIKVSDNLYHLASFIKTEWCDPKDVIRA